MSFSGPQDHNITKQTFIKAFDSKRLGTLAWESFLGSLSNDPNSGYYGTSFDRPSISGTPGYIVNYLFASGIIDGPTLDQIITDNGGDPNGYYAGIINSNPITKTSYNWHKAREFNVEYCEEKGCRDPDMQRFYDKWKASGQPTTKDGMLTDPQYDEWLSDPANTLIPGVDAQGNPNSSLDDIRDALIKEGTSPEIIDTIFNGSLRNWGDREEFIPGVRYDTTGRAADYLEEYLEDLTGKDWDISSWPTEEYDTYDVDYNNDGVTDIVIIKDSSGDYTEVYGGGVDPNGIGVKNTIEGYHEDIDIYDEVTSSEGFDDLEDWEKNKLLKEGGFYGYGWDRDGWFGGGPDDYSEFGICEDGTIKQDTLGTNCEEYSEFGFCEDGTKKADEAGSNCPLTEEGLVRDYGQEAVDKVKEIYNGVKDWIEGAIEDPLGTVKGILDTVYPGLPAECKDGTNKPDDWWKDCTTISVLGQIPGLPLPLPPGTIDVNTTVRDLEDAAKEAGKTLEDIFNPTCTGTPAQIEECENRTISDIIGDWASDVWDDIKGAWEDLEDKTEEGLLNILIDAGYNILSGWILTQVKDAVSADNPLAFVPLENCVDQDWLEQASPEQKALCNNVVNCEEQGLTGGWVRDIGECVDPDPNDCAGQDKALKSDGTCGECLDASKKDFGQGCVAVCEYDESLPADSPECKEPWTDKGPEEQQCTAEGRLHVPGDAATETDSSCGDCLPTHIDEDGTCKEWTDGGPTEEECTEQNKVYRPSTGTGRDSSCGGCLDNFELINGECKEEGFEPPCPGKQVRNEETRECEDPPPDFVPGDPCTTEDGKAGTFDSEGVCVPDWVNPGPTVQDCEALGKTHVSGDPSAQKPSECGGCKNSTWNPIGANGECVAPVKCWDDSTVATEAECPEEPPKVDCASENKIQETPYECGGCLPNFELDPNSQECVAPKECKEGNEDTTVTEEITLPYGVVVRGKPPTYEDNGTQCVMTTYTYVNEDPTAAQCEEVGKVLSEDGKTCVDAPVEQPCQNNAIDAPECEDCGDNTTPSQHEDGDCKKPLTVKPDNCGPDTYTQERTVEVSVGSGEPQEPTTQYVVYDGACTKLTTVYVEGPSGPPPGPPPGPNTCADGMPPAENIGECVECPEGSDYPNASSLAACNAPPKECNAETATKTINLTETIKYGDPLPDPTTTYEDDGTQCVATTTTYVEEPNPCATIDDSNYDECGYDKCEEGSESPYVKDGVKCIASVIKCTDPNRNTNEDESCAEGCKDGYRLQPGEGGETLCLPPQFPCWDNTLAFTEAECSEEPPKVNCADANRKQLDAYTCGPCLAGYKEGEEGCVPETCEDKGQTTSPIDGECRDCSGEITHKNFNHCGYKNCGNSVYIPKDQKCDETDVCEGDNKAPEGPDGCYTCPDNTPKAGQSVSSPTACGSIVGPECDEDNLTPETAAACGKQLCNGEYIDIELPCVTLPPPEVCEDSAETDFGRGCEKPCPDNANIGISDAACGTTVTVCLDDTATNFNEEGPCEFGPPVDPKCENGATDYPLCSECPDGSLPDADLGCGVDDPCDDPDYAAANPEECTPGPNCVDCTCAKYAEANPEECGPPPPPPPTGGGGGGSGGQGKRDPFEFGISGDPELLDRMQFPITDYLSGLFTGNR